MGNQLNIPGEWVEGRMPEQTKQRHCLTKNTQAWELATEKTSETRGVRGHAPPKMFFDYIEIDAIWGHLTA